MKSTHVKNETEEIEFPCLMINPETKTIILATSKSGSGYEGIVIFKKNTEEGLIFEFGSSWSNCFKPLPKGEQIILEN